MEPGHLGLSTRFAMPLVEGVPRSGFAHALIRREVRVGPTVLTAIAKHKPVTIFHAPLVSEAITIS